MDQTIRFDKGLRTLIVPAILSIVSLSITLYVFDRWERAATSEPPGAEQVATLKASTAKIERRSKSRIIWQGIEQGGPLYAGDAIRTPPKVEGDVQLIQGDTIITLEPDSLIVLDKAKGRLELNLVSGSLMVDSKGSSKSKDAGPMIRSGKTQIELGKGNSQLSLAKGKDAEAVVAVGKGEVAVLAGEKRVVVGEGKTGTVSSTGITATAGIETFAPKPNEVLLLNALPGRQAAFRWKATTDGQTSLELGPYRTELKTAATAASGAGQLMAAVPTGPFYWRLVRRDNGGKVLASSAVLRADALFLSPPALFAPSDGEAVLQKTKAVSVTFQWGKPAKADDVTLEVSGDWGFATNVSRFPVKPEEQERAVTLEKPGTYYWRVVAKWESLSSRVLSETRHFEIRKAADVPAPKLTAPAGGQELAESLIKAKGVFLEWERVPGVDKYRVQVAIGSQIKVDESPSTTGLRLRELAAGSYDWRVMALTDGVTSKWSAPRRLKVTRVAELKWLSEFDQPVESVTAKPTVSLKWEKGLAAKAWRVRSAGNREGLAAAGWTREPKSGATLSPGPEGTYFFEVQALGEGDLVVGASPPLRVELKARAELGPPQWRATKPALQAKADGSLTLEWKKVDGAASYGLLLTEEKSGKSREFKSKEADYLLSDLLPGTYQVKLRSNGAKPGPFGKSKQILVPATSDVPPPVFSDFKVH